MKHLLLCVAFLSVVAVPQQSQKVQDQLTRPRFVSGPVPIVFGKRNDGFPEKMIARGTISDLTFSDAACGVIAWAGTVKIRLTESIPGYDHDDVFVMLPCFPDFEKYGRERERYLNRAVSLEVSKLYPEYNFGLLTNVRKVPCAFEIINNSLDSKKTPFYCTNANVSGNIEATEKKLSEKP